MIKCALSFFTNAYTTVYYIHKIQFGESTSPARKLILDFENAAQTHIVSGSFPVLPTNYVRNLDASVPPKIIIQ